MIKAFITTLLMLPLAGCIIIGNTAPKGNSDFSQTIETRQLKGVYKNSGDPNGYLSWSIWKAPYVVDIFGRNVPHKEIELIEVLSSGNTLTVNAIKDGRIIYRQDYIQDRDFTFKDGKIVIKDESNLLSRGSGDVLVGPSYEKVEIGLDLNGNGKYKGQTYFAGLVFLLFPMAGGGSSEVKFTKLSSNITFELCKTPQK